MSEVTPMRVELLPGPEGDGVQASLGVGQLDALALAEGSAAQVGTDGGHGARV